MVMSDDISFCPKDKCRRKTCMRNQMNIRDRTIPHSFFVEIPPDCPYNKHDTNHGIYHIRKKTLQDNDIEKDGIVRCTDCKHAKQTQKNGSWYCNNRPRMDRVTMQPDDWYCADGERKDG